MADNSCPCQVKRESMEIIFELLIQFLLEMFVQGAFELGFRGMLSIFGGFGERKDEERFNPWLAVCGYIFMGAVSGGISVWVLPMHLLQPPAIQILNLAITPIALGFIFEILGRWRSKTDKPRYAVDHFSYGFSFALAMGVIRYFCAA